MTALVVTCDREANSAELMGADDREAGASHPCGGGRPTRGDRQHRRHRQSAPGQNWRPNVTRCRPTSPTEARRGRPTRISRRPPEVPAGTARCTPAPATGGLATRSPRTRPRGVAHHGEEPDLFEGPVEQRRQHRASGSPCVTTTAVRPGFVRPSRRRWQP